MIGNALSMHHYIRFLQDVRDFEKGVLYYLHGPVASKQLLRSYLLTFPVKLLHERILWAQPVLAAPFI